MDRLFGDEWLGPTGTTVPEAGHIPAGRGVLDRSFPVRVAALLRSRPIADLVGGASRQEWPPDTYDPATLALAAIDLVIAHQGFEYETTYADVVAELERLARKAAPHRPAEEHLRVARYTVDGLLNRSGRETPFTYRISDYTAEDVEHRQRQVQFRLLVEREDPARGDVVLNATGDAINALVGGLEFEVEDEQVANEILLERQLARGAFAAAERAAVRARLLSVSLAEGLQTLIRQTRRDLRAVLDDWASGVPQSLDAARAHIRGRLEVEHRLLVKVRETVLSDEPEVARASARIAALLEESRKRHETLHSTVIEARSVFLEEQDRQSFRPPASGYLPDVYSEILGPMLSLPTETASVLGGSWLGNVSGPRPSRLPRLYRLVNDLWAVRETPAEPVAATAEDTLATPDEPALRPVAVEAARRAVVAVGLPARLSALIAACLTDPLTATMQDRRQAAEVTALSALWCFSPEETSEGSGVRTDVAARVLGPRAVADADDVRLVLPGWDGDDLVVAPYADALADADPPPVTALPALPALSVTGAPADGISVTRCPRDEAIPAEGVPC